MSLVPVWLLDVDGVLNADRPGWGGAPRSAMAYSGGNSYRIRWAPPLLDRVRAVHAGGLAEIRWCTTWCHQADQLEKLFDLPELARSLTVSPIPPSPDNWPLKLSAAGEVLRSGRPLIWTDDDAIPGPGPERDELLSTGRVLLVEPKPDRGLQPTDLDAIEEFARRWSATETQETGPHQQETLAR